MLRFFLISLFLLSIITEGLNSQTTNDTTSYGPSKGTLIAIGGGSLDTDIINQFKKYAGGDSAHIVIIPTAYSDSRLKRDSAFIKIRSQIGQFGFSNITILHTRDTSVANDDSFIEPLKRANGIFITGGRQWRLVKAYQNTKVYEEMINLLNRGGVIAGTSAGASIQADCMVRGDTTNNQIMIGAYSQGFGFVKNVAIDQHVIARDRHFDMYQVQKKYPNILGLGLDESTAIVIRGDTLEVVGQSYALIYDGNFFSNEGSELKKLPDTQYLFYFLGDGAKYNMRERRRITPKD